MDFYLFLNFLVFFVSALFLIVSFLYLYALVTPYDDYELIFKENNIAASLSFGGAIIGVALPIYSAVENSISYFDFLIWGVIAILIQLSFAFIVTRISGKYSFKEKISEGVVATGILMTFLSIAIGLINAASMSY